MTAVVNSINEFIESTPTPSFFKWLNYEEPINCDLIDTTMTSSVISENGIKVEKPDDSDDSEVVKLLPPSFDELADDTFILFHRGLADDWNEYFVQVGDWLVSNSATEGADSHPDSENEEEGKAGFASAIGDVTHAIEGLANFNLSGVSSRASASAKTVGSFFSTAFSKAGESVKVASSKIQGVVEKNPLLAEFNKEQEAFIKAKGGKVGEALPPWVGYPEEEKLKEEILSLSTERRNFVRSPPTGVSFEFELEQFLPVAQATLAADPELEKMRFELVPKTINEETFWRNYFYRVGLIRQSTELSSLEKEGAQESESTEQAENDATKGKSKVEELDQLDSAGQVTDAEFVSDSFQPSSTTEVEEVKEGINKITQSTGEEDWEAELREELGAELGDYEVVSGNNKDNDQWEEEIQNMIDDEDSTDLR